MNPRKPTREERVEMWRFVAMDLEETKRSVKELYRDLCIVVFDDYVTSSPGYCGKVLIVISDFDPSFHETYIWENGAIKRLREEG